MDKDALVMGGTPVDPEPTDPDPTDPPSGGIDYSKLETIRPAIENPEYIMVGPDEKGASYELKGASRVKLELAEDATDWGQLTNTMQLGANGNLYVNGSDTGRKLEDGWIDIEGTHLFNGPGQWNALRCRITGLE